MTDKIDNKNPSNGDGISRREFAKRSIQSGAAAGALATGLTSGQASATNIQFTNEEFEYIIVGSGAGGGPLAANLAKAGFSVLLLEAGEDDPSDDIHNIPAFHALSSEDPKLSWHFFVKHYANQARAEADSKYVPSQGGILYPRASTIGGCTTHHAMITVYPHNSDFNRIAEITGDASWGASRMRRYFERLERCEHVPRPFFPWFNPSRHGFNGWLPTNTADLSLLREDPVVFDIVLGAILKNGLGDAIGEILSGNLGLDINNWRVARGEEGAFIAPTATNSNRQRQGVRELLLSTQERYPNNLTIRTNSLVSRVLFNEKTAVGVEYVKGKHLYKADGLNSSAQPTAIEQVRASREVILAGGAFNSPQLLKLSGVGPAAELEAHNIPVVVDLPGVGENLQDRYEVGVVNELNEELPLVKDCTFGGENDPCMIRYKAKTGKNDRGPYGTNGVTISMVKKSSPQLEDPDLFIFGAPGDFHGYYPGYSRDITDKKSRFTWIVLKGHTNNSAGTVKLKSNSPLDTPDINFKYFDEGNDNVGTDLSGVIDGVRTARSFMASNRAQRRVAYEVYPGENRQSDEELGEFVKNEAWGHHASCTNKIGAQGDPMAVLDSNFKVYGTQNLRVVDASVFPYIPGFFIVTPIYMISEKASDVIIADARRRS